MSQITPSKAYAAYAAVMIAGIVAIPLWSEFHESGQILWNVFLALFLMAIVAASFIGVRFLQRNQAEIGEARFDTVHRGEGGR